MHEAEKSLLLREVSDLVHIGLLDQLGGSLAMRLKDGNILLTPAGAAFRRWRIEEAQLVVVDRTGLLIEGGEFKANATAPVYLKIFEHLPEVGGIAHCHAPHSLVYAACNHAVPSMTNGCDTLGEIPCVRQNQTDAELKQQCLANPIEAAIPSGLLQRRDVYAIHDSLGKLVVETLSPRREELKRHGLAFTVHRHGLFAVGRTLQEAAENLFRVERSAQISLMAAHAKLM